MSDLNQFLTKLYEDADEYMSPGYLNNVYSDYSQKQKEQIAIDNLSYPKTLSEIEKILELIKELKYLTNNNIRLLDIAIKKDKELSAKEKNILFEFLTYIK